MLNVFSRPRFRRYKVSTEVVLASDVLWCSVKVKSTASMLVASASSRVVTPRLTLVTDLSLARLKHQTFGSGESRVLASRVSGCLLDSLVHRKYLILGKKTP